MLKSEDHFLEIVNSLFPREHPHMVVGRGDDCAVLKCPASLCMSSDLFLEDVHFRTRYFTPEDIGHKALAVNLSDLAAGGARPLGFNLNLIWPVYLDEEFCRSMLSSMAELGAKFKLALTGGDLSFGKSLGLAVCIWGKSPARQMLRGKAEPGDVLFVVGKAGLAACGLSLLEENDPGLDRYPECVAQHLRPRPLVREGQVLAGIEEVKGLMDVSDGLARDLPRFCRRGTGVEICSDFRVHPEVASFCRDRGLDPLATALKGGEDYALLGACTRKGWDTVKKKVMDCRRLGTVTDKPGIFLQDRELGLKGFDHFEK
ncbi:thiamine-phosphate kinase [Desulfonatronospira sp.]|uniref:thiamine-phosphate kinase n=1 Tax=Desulfonatronospira sp. TaxID=1962951 RepID=UPI0025C2AF10|nr:thiamine-phosphate kinase [Desulfonatronospira sp.]